MWRTHLFFILIHNARASHWSIFVSKIALWASLLRGTEKTSTRAAWTS